MNASDVRKALDEVLREAYKSTFREEGGRLRDENHPWRLSVTDETTEYLYDDCSSHNEGQNCCLDPGHGAYDRLLDYLAERVASKLMYRGGVVTNVIATTGEEIDPPFRLVAGDPPKIEDV